MRDNKSIYPLLNWTRHWAKIGPNTSIFDAFARRLQKQTTRLRFLFSVRLLSLEAVFRTAALQVFACYSLLTVVLYRNAVVSLLLQNLTCQYNNEY